MANHKSAIKRNKQSQARRLRNRTQKAALRTVIKKFNASLGEGADSAKEVLSQAVPVIAKAASRGLIHQNAAARRISRLTKKLNKAASAGQGA